MRGQYLIVNWFPRLIRYARACRQRTPSLHTSVGYREFRARVGKDNYWKDPGRAREINSSNKKYSMTEKKDFLEGHLKRPWREKHYFEGSINDLLSDLDGNISVKQKNSVKETEIPPCKIVEGKIFSWRVLEGNTSVEQKHPESKISSITKTYCIYHTTTVFQKEGSGGQCLEDYTTVWQWQVIWGWPLRTRRTKGTVPTPVPKEMSALFIAVGHHELASTGENPYSSYQSSPRYLNSQLHPYLCCKLWLRRRWRFGIL